MSRQAGSGLGTRLFALALVAVVLTSGCASVDFDYPKSQTTAFEDTADTYLARQIGGLEDQEPGTAGFYLLSDSLDSLAARLLLARRAERSLDAQYYLISNDNVGYVFIGSLLDAADRGVRVFALAFTSNYPWDPIVLFAGYILLQMSSWFVPLVLKGN